MPHYACHTSVEVDGDILSMQRLFVVGGDNGGDIDFDASVVEP